MFYFFLFHFIVLLLRSIFSVSGVFLRQRDHRGPVEVPELVEPEGRRLGHELVDSGTRVSGRKGLARTNKRRRKQQHGKHLT